MGAFSEAFSSPLVRKYLVPGVVFPSVLVGGGYGTGREVVEFFTRFGARGGVFGLGVTVACWTVVPSWQTFPRSSRVRSPSSV